VFKSLHSPDYFWSEAYAMHAAMMKLGVNKIYYREDPNQERKPLEKNLEKGMSKVESNRDKKRKALAQ